MKMFPLRNYEKLLQFPENYRFGIAIAIGNGTVTKEAHPIHEGRVSFIG